MSVGVRTDTSVQRGVGAGAGALEGRADILAMLLRVTREGRVYAQLEP